MNFEEEKKVALSESRKRDDKKARKERHEQDSDSRAKDRQRELRD